MTCAGAASTGSGRGRGVESDEARNTAYEGSTASGARSGATGATGTQGYSSGTTGSAGVTEGVRGLNITDKSGVSCYCSSPTFFRQLCFFAAAQVFMLILSKNCLCSAVQHQRHYDGGQPHL